MFFDSLLMRHIKHKHKLHNSNARGHMVASSDFFFFLSTGEVITWLISTIYSQIPGEKMYWLAWAGFVLILPGTSCTYIQCDLCLRLSRMSTSSLIEFAPRRHHTCHSFHSEIIEILCNKTEWWDEHMIKFCSNKGASPVESLKNGTAQNLRRKQLRAY